MEAVEAVKGGEALPPGIPLKKEAASPRQMGQVRLDCKKNKKNNKLIHLLLVNMTLLQTGRKKGQSNRPNLLW